MVRKCRKDKGTVEAGIGSSSTYMQLRSRRIVYVGVNSRSEKSSSVVDDNGVSSSNLSSCCASNEYNNKNSGFIDLEEERDDETETSTYRRSTKRKLFETFKEQETSKSMEDSPQIVAVKETSDCCCSGRISLPTTEEKAKSTTEQPTVDEVEDFFVAAEKQLQDKFKKKYNFDFEEEKPLEGRYEWVKLSE